MDRRFQGLSHPAVADRTLDWLSSMALTDQLLKLESLVAQLYYIAIVTWASGNIWLCSAVVLRQHAVHM